MANTIKFTGKLKVEVDLSHLGEMYGNEIELACHEMKMKYIGKMVCKNKNTPKNVRSCFEIIKFRDTYFDFEFYDGDNGKYVFVFESLPEDTNIEADYEPLTNYKYCLEYDNGEEIKKWYYKIIEAAEAIAVARSYGENATIREI